MKKYNQLYLDYNNLTHDWFEDNLKAFRNELAKERLPNIKEIQMHLPNYGGLTLENYFEAILPELIKHRFNWDGSTLTIYIK